VLAIEYEEWRMSGGEKREGVFFSKDSPEEKIQEVA